MFRRLRLLFRIISSRMLVCIRRRSCWPLSLCHGFVWFVMPQTAATGFTFIHQGGMYVSTGGVIGIDAGGLTSNSGLTITAGGSLLYSDEQVRAYLTIDVLVYPQS
jgi:hypothetical protein